MNNEELCNSSTPDHLVHGWGWFNRSNNALDEVSDKDDCREIPQFHKNIIQLFKKRFVNENLTALRERNYCQERKCCKANNIVTIGDIVLVKGENKNRKIIKLIKGRDEIVREVQLVTYQ